MEQELFVVVHDEEGRQHQGHGDCSEDFAVNIQLVFSAIVDTHLHSLITSLGKHGVINIVRHNSI